MEGEPGRRILDRSRLKHRDDIGVVPEDVSLLLEALASLITRNETPLSQRLSPMSRRGSALIIADSMAQPAAGDTQQIAIPAW